MNEDECDNTQTENAFFLVDFFCFFATAECNIPLFDSEGEAVVNHK